MFSARQPIIFRRVVRLCGSKPYPEVSTTLTFSRVMSVSVDVLSGVVPQ